MSDSPLLIRNVTRAVHLIITGYGHWLPNDPRGSGSSSVRAPKLKDYGPTHFGRKKQQPSRGELRAFHRDVEAKLEHQWICWRGSPDMLMKRFMLKSSRQTDTRSGRIDPTKFISATTRKSDKSFDM